jgi:hypothetical protein
MANWDRVGFRRGTFDGEAKSAAPPPDESTPSLAATEGAGVALALSAAEEEPGTEDPRGTGERTCLR